MGGGVGAVSKWSCFLLLDLLHKLDWVQKPPSLKTRLRPPPKHNTKVTCSAFRVSCAWCGRRPHNKKKYYNNTCTLWLHMPPKRLKRHSKNQRNYIPGGVYFRRSRPQSFLVMILSERDILKNQRNDIPGSTKLGQKFPRKLSFVSKQECSAIKFASPIHFVRRND